MARVFFTGFPGFLGSELLPRVLRRDPDSSAVCLVEPRFVSLARSRGDQIMGADPALRGRIDFVAGDITSADLGMANDRGLPGPVTDIYHLAAIYDLSVSPEVGLRVNVEGTRNVLAFASRCPSLRRLHYVSSCYVSGRFDGVFTESDLEKGQRFNNSYEETKYLAEVEVQKAMRGGLPATIYRPSIVVGDSTTGATQKYDGPYYAIQWIVRQRGVALMPVVGDPRRTELNVVPRDFVVGAIAHLSGIAQSAGKVYHLCDPEPLTVDELLRELGRATGRNILRIRVPRRLAKFSIDRLPGVYKLTRIPSAVIDYFVHPTRYRAPLTQPELESAGIRVPRFADYSAKLVSFFRAHRL